LILDIHHNNRDDEEDDRDPDRGGEEDLLRAAPLDVSRAGAAEGGGQSRCAVLQEDEESQEDAEVDFDGEEDVRHSGCMVEESQESGNELRAGGQHSLLVGLPSEAEATQL